MYKRTTAPSVEIPSKAANQCNEHNVEKYIQWVTTPSLKIRVYLHSFSRWWLPHLRRPAKFRENSKL